MNQQMMLGMFLGGVVLAAPPVLLTLGVLIYVLHRRRIEKRDLLRESTDEPKT